MRIAFVTFEYPPFIIGGAGVYALNVTHELAKLGHQIIVFVPDIPGIKYEKDLENIVFNKVKINNKLPFNALQYWLIYHAEVKKEELIKNLI
jgi:glycogen synthase